MFVCSTEAVVKHFFVTVPMKGLDSRHSISVSTYIICVVNINPMPVGDKINSSDLKARTSFLRP